MAKEAFDGEPGSAGFLDGTWNGRRLLADR